jgi:hypothetical protein
MLRPRSGLAFALIASSTLALTGVASAHIALKSPPARTNDQIQLKTGPCGQTTNARTKNVTVFKPGETITVAWDETINHPGHYRIAFDPNGTNFPNPKSFTDVDGGVNVLVDGIPDKTGAAPIAYTQKVTLPNVECANCTLQLIQVMTDKPPYDPGPTGNDIYYQCADLVLTSGDAGIPVADGGGGDAGGADATSPVDAGSSGDAGASPVPGDEAGCACSTPGHAVTSSGGGLALLLAAVAMARVARRRRGGS